MDISDPDILETIDQLHRQGKAPRVGDISDALPGSEPDALKTQLERLGRSGAIWMVAWWWESDEFEFSYYVHRGDADDDIKGRNLDS